MDKGFLIVLSSPSGGGKTTLRKEILKKEEEILYSVSYTTRKSRKDEVKGKDYHFISKEEFSNLVKKDKLLEWAEVHGNLYGTPKDFVEENLKKGEIILLDIDVQGAKKIKGYNLPAIFIFIIPPSWEELRKRLEKRKTERGNEIEKRLKRAKEEMMFYHDYDYIVINDDLKKTVEEIRCIIKAEKLKKRKMAKWVKKLI